MRWITHVNPEELSIFDSKFTTNNGAESYHARLKDRIRANHPRIWSFMTHINEITMDLDNEFGMLSLGKDITRPRNKTNILTDERRSRCKQKFQSGCYIPWEYINAVNQAIGNIRDPQGELEFSDCSEDSETDHIDDDNNNHQKCVVCLTHEHPLESFYLASMPSAVWNVANKSKNLDNRVPSVCLQKKGGLKYLPISFTIDTFIKYLTICLGLIKFFPNKHRFYLLV